MKQALVDVDSPPDGAECPSPFPRTPPADPQDWQSVHQQLVRLSEHKAAYDHAEPQWLLRASRMQVHLRLGYGSFYEYAERLFGYSPRETAERLRVAEALEELPEMASALRRNALPWTAVRELARVATPATEPQWIQAAKGRTVREIEKMVSGRKPGDGPSDPADESARTQVVRFEVRAETLATLREAKAALIRRMGQHLTDDELILLLSREVLGGPSDEGRSPYQVALRVCDDCGKAHQEAGGDALPVEADVAERAACDSQRIGAVGGPDVETGEQDPPMRPSDAKPTHVGQPGIDSTHVGLPIQPPRASQTIPPAVRRQVLRRDGGKCLVPGCRNHAFLEVHHSEPRAEGGTHDPDLLATLCGVHHRAVHQGTLRITGRASTGFVFVHADGTRYGGAPSPVHAELYAQAFSALKNLGYKEAEARAAVDWAQAHVGPDSGLAELLRVALSGMPGPGAPRVSTLRERQDVYMRLVA